MNDSPRGETDHVDKQQALITEFITDMNRELARLRAGSADLVALHPASWRGLQIAAHNIGARAEGLELQVLQTCARQLEGFAIEVLTPSASNKPESIEGAMVALEMLDLESRALNRNLVSRAR
jgi:hypothetical protein